MATDAAHSTRTRRLVALLAFLACAAVFPALAQTATAAAAPTLRLPTGARPTRYALTLTVVPGAADVAGEIAIDVDLADAHALLWLNAADVTIAGVSVDGAKDRARVQDGNDQFVGLAFDPPLPAGAHHLVLAFAARQSRNSARGIFGLQDNGAWYTMTQFEPIFARQAFPCFDEPGFKTPWQLTLRVPRGLTALANSPVVSEQDTDDGMKRVEFAPTKPLPSYLVAFAVGPFEIVDAGRSGSSATPLRLIAGRGHRADLAFAAQALPELFAREERWFGIAYPFAKLDHVAIPLAVRFAMENAGLITYGAPVLLQPHAATPPFRHALANVAAHEMAHQWFGNLVTTAWWDDIWLNEAFATWFADKMVDDWQPAYEHGAGRVDARADAIEADALSSARRIREPIVTRGDIFNAFDAITYVKGATVIGMFEGWLGDDVFRRGVRAYLDAHRESNASVDDFLGALSTVTAKPVASAFKTFLEQNGVPQVGVALDCSTRPRLELSQQRHAAAGAPSSGERWQIPVCVRYGNAASAREACTLLDGAEATLALEGACPAFVLANAGGRGYYVPAYRGDLLAKLASARAALTAAERASVVYDLRPLLRAGAVGVPAVFDWIRTGAASQERSVVVAALELAQFVRDNVVPDEARGHFAAYVQRVFVPRARALGFVPRPGESDDDQLMRRQLLRFAAPDDPRLSREARRLAYQWLRDRRAVDPAIVDTVLFVAARTGNARLFDAMLGALDPSGDASDRRNLMVALLSFRDPALARRALELLLDPHIDIRDAITALRTADDLSPPRRAPYDFITAHFDALAARVDRDAPGGWPRYAAALCDAQARVAVEAFWQPRVARYAGAERNLAETLESIDACAQLRAREGPHAAAYLARYR